MSITSWLAQLVVCGALLVAALPTDALAQGHDAAQETSSPVVDLSRLVWVDRSSGMVERGVGAITIAPAGAPTLYAGGRGFVARSEDNGETWRPVLLLVGGDTEGEETDVIEVSDEDLDRFDDTEALERYEEQREELFDELSEQYGEAFAQTLILEMESDLRDDAFSDLVDEIAAVGDEQAYQQRIQRLQAAGLAEDEAEAFASDPLTVWELLVDPAQPDWVYAATGLGLYRSRDRGVRWEKVLGGEGVEGRGVLSVAVSGQGKTVLAGTVGGLRASDDGGRTWHPAVGEVGGDPVRLVVNAAPRESRFFALGKNRLFRSDDAGLTWSGVDLMGFRGYEVRDIAMLAGFPDTLLVATDNSVFRSDDGGETWHPLASVGLATGTVQSLVLPRNSPDTVLVLADRDVFLSKGPDEDWVGVNDGLVGQHLLTGAVTASGEVWLATSIGVAVGLIGKDAVEAAEKVRAVAEVWAHEPSPAQTLWAALLYHGLADSPVDGWHTQLKASLFVPQADLRLHYRQTRTENEYALWNSINPDDLESAWPMTRQSRWAAIANPDFSWQVLALWDIGAIVHHPAETGIESARQQILKARTTLAQRMVRVLIERRALQLRAATMATRGPDQVSLDKRVRITLELEELTALLDGLTGGFYSATVQANKTHAPAGASSAPPKP